ncbi:hypothetical protein [Clostridium cochlearium]|uniref:Uncharacterized protein n=1 Tax=Clostridium cochlearium TaxID=1494 RepID=A0A7Y3V6U8_CLOCO|nr:hypothetical protein [Clostridium cochlearium]NOH14894.1 hypothetical protein [Clostridium cochlearium]
MNELQKCLESFLTFLNWDKEKFNENETYFSFMKKCKNEDEIKKMLNYDYRHIFKIFDDTFEIIFRNTESLLTSKCIKKDFKKEYLVEYMEDTFEPYGYVDIELKIDKKKYYLKQEEFKNIKNKFTIIPFFYSKNFVNWIEQFNFKELEEKVFSIDKQIIFLINDCNYTLYNDNVLITNKNISNDIIQKFLKRFDINRNKEIARWRYEQVNWLDGTKWLNPDYFYFDFKCTNINELLKNYFLKNLVNLVIPHISNYVVYENGNFLNTINGHKKITIKINELDNYSQEQVNYLYEIYKWAYTGKNSDKLGILRNLITIFLCEDCGRNYYELLLKKSKGIYNTAIKNFDIYLKENVEKYFEARQRTMDLIENKSNEVSNEISNTISNMNKTLFAFLGTIFTAIISFVENTNDILIKFLLISFIVYVVIYSSYYLSYSIIKVNQINKYYNEIILKISDNLLGINTSEDNDNKKFSDSIDKNVKIFNWYWFITIVVNIVLIGIAFFSLEKLDGIVEVLKISN